MIIESILNRKSGFAFSSKTIEKGALKSLFEAAQLAPSSMNIQPWRYIFANSDEPEFQLMLDTLAERNKIWAKHASTLLLSIAQAKYNYKNNLIHNAYAWHDTGMANALLMVQAASMGIVSHPMGGFDHQKASANFYLTNDYEPVAVIALGYKGDESKLPEEILKRQNAPRSRKPINEIAFKGKIS